MDPRFMVLKLTQSIPLMPNGFAGILVYGTMEFIGGMPTGVALIKVATKTIHDLGAVANVIKQQFYLFTLYNGYTYTRDCRNCIPTKNGLDSACMEHDR